ncbi:MAG: S8 family serine peptidase, partial [Candidatus Eisenbacteria sp.]|nr:S8 family serine peptidase [Candidatus Eisenbacteria bacterium]
MKRFVVLVILFVPAFLLTPRLAQSLDTVTRPVGPVRYWEVTDLQGFNPEWLQVKFVEGSNVWLEGDRFDDDSGLDLTHLNARITCSAVVAIHPTFRHNRAVLRTWKAAGEARYGATGPDLSLWFNLRTEGGRSEIAQLLNELNASPAVEIAHPIPIVELAHLCPAREQMAPTVTAERDTPDFTHLQDYLYDTPVGLDAPAAWALPGGRGAGTKFIDVEGCWTEDHEDFPYDQYFYEGGAPEDPLGETHGTAVLGEVIGRHNDIGINGFAPDASYGVVAFDMGTYPDISQYFQEAVDHLDPGDIWLIELQMFPPGHEATPMEWLQVNYDVIWTSVWSLGIACVEPAANGGQDLDDPSWGGLFDRNVRDSGAMMVAAGTPFGRVAEGFTNYGSRMDMHAWGSEIVTTGFGDLYNGGTLQERYTELFGGTSGASPMVVGCGLCVQGIARASRGEPLDPIELRALLHDTGVPHLDPFKEIGPRPDLAAATAMFLSDAPEGALVAQSSLTGAPNPFHSRVDICFTVPRPGEVRLVI